MDRQETFQLNGAGEDNFPKRAPILLGERESMDLLKSIISCSGDFETEERKKLYVESLNEYLLEHCPWARKRIRMQWINFLIWKRFFPRAL